MSPEYSGVVDDLFVPAAQATACDDRPQLRRDHARTCPRTSAPGAPHRELSLGAASLWSRLRGTGRSALPVLGLRRPVRSHVTASTRTRAADTPLLLRRWSCEHRRTSCTDLGGGRCACDLRCPCRLARR